MLVEDSIVLIATGVDVIVTLREMEWEMDPLAAMMVRV
jgi:hypothetical protein